MPNCKKCNTSFEITDKDREFYKIFEVPEPTQCPECRARRRMSWGNQINLYKRKCDKTGEAIVTAYHPSSPLKVYKQTVWHDVNQFDARDYGRDYDFNRPFFDQWKELADKVPRPALHSDFQFDENSDYTNYAGKNKDCYMLFDSDYNWDCMYGMGINKSKNSLDNFRIKECELCYECIDCVKCFNLKYSQDSENCADSAFLKNCIGVKNSFMCSNLKNKQYYVFNKPYDKTVYEKLMASLSQNSELVKYLKDWWDFKIKYPQKALHGVHNENVLGDYVVHSKDSENVFDSMELWDCKNFNRSFGSAKNCMDCEECGDGIERIYESAYCGYNSLDIRFSMLCFNQQSNLTYAYYCNFSKNLFGCVGINRKEYCILNKQYTQEEYEALVPKIIEHMKSTGEWGEFFPAEFSDFAYNESVANEYMPLTKEEALAKGLRWLDKDTSEYQPATAKLPNNSQEADKSICESVFACIDCGRNYKIIEQELKLIKNIGIPLPEKCFICRHMSRSKLRNGRKFYQRKCAKTGEEITTTYPPDSPWIVYSEKAYLESLE